MGYSFANGNVHDQLVAEKIYFPAVGSAALDPKEFPDLQRYDRQQLTSGEQAKAYDDGFIGRHLKTIAAGKTRMSRVSWNFGAVMALRARADRGITGVLSRVRRPVAGALRSPVRVARRRGAEQISAEHERDRLQTSEERLRMLVDGTRDYAIFMLDPDGTIATWNLGAQRLKGYTEAEAVGQHFSIFYTDEQRAAGHPDHELAVATSTGRYEEEAWRVRKDGTQFWASVVITALRSEDGALRGFGKVTRDITERRIADQALQDLAALRESERRAEDRLQRLAFVALELVGAETVEDLTEIVFNRGPPVLGADGGAVVVRADENVLQLAVSDRLGEHVQRTYGVLPIDDPLPASYVARTGERLVLPTRQSGLAFTPAMGPLQEATRCSAWVFTPLKVGNRVLGALAVSWVDERQFTDDELTVIEAFGAQCAQALDRIRIAETQRGTALQVARLGEALQRNLLTQPPTPTELDIAVRYLPAVHEAQIGGDWYDAFDSASGATVISVGDVAGHDLLATAAMAQLRNLLRGLAVDSDDSSAMLLTRLDRAIARLGLDTLATALVARIDSGPVDQRRGARRVRWSSAGHLPPMLRLPDGTVRALVGKPDLLLGLDPNTDRVERVTDLPDGSTLLIYTDGLVERRGESLDAGLRRLAQALAAAGNVGPEQVCDRLLDAMLPDAPEDDVAMLVLKPHARTTAVQ